MWRTFVINQLLVWSCHCLTWSLPMAPASQWESSVWPISATACLISFLLPLPIHSLSVFPASRTCSNTGSISLVLLCLEGFSLTQPHDLVSHLLQIVAQIFGNTSLKNPCVKLWLFSSSSHLYLLFNEFFSKALITMEYTITYSLIDFSFLSSEKRSCLQEEFLFVFNCSHWYPA